MRRRFEETEGGVYVERDENGQIDRPIALKQKYLDFNWTHNEALPARLLKGFRVAIFTGNDPNATDNYLREPVDLGPSERRLVLTVRVKSTTTINAAVQALYHNGNQSSWRLLNGGVATDPDTVVMANAQLTNVSNGAVKASHIAAGAVTSPAIAAQAVSSVNVLVPPQDNLVPNGWSEAGAAAVGKTPEGTFLVNDPTNALEGNWCRRITLQAGWANGWNITPKISGTPGDEFFAEIWMKTSSALSTSNGGTLYFLYLAKSGNYEFNGNAGVNTESLQVGSYKKFTVKGKIPAGFTGVQLYWEMNCPAADAGKMLYFDCITTRKMVTFDLLVANTIKTGNYVEDGNGNAVYGAKMENTGTDTSIPSLKVGINGMRVGPHPFGDAFFRSLKGLDGSVNGKTIYRGNNDTAARGGAPNIWCLHIRPIDGFTFGDHSYTVWGFRIQTYAATWATDNLDSLRMLDVQFWRGYSTGASYWRWSGVQIADRKYASADDNSGSNMVSGQFSMAGGWNFSSTTAISGPYIYLLVSMHNAYGASDQLWFRPPSAFDVDCTRQTASPFNGGSSGGTGGGGGSTGGTCPAPWEPVLLEDGSSVPAELLRPGMRVLTVHEHNQAMGTFLITSVEVGQGRRWRLQLQDGRTFTASENHRMLSRERGFTKIQDLRPGEMVEGFNPGRVTRVDFVDVGPVIRLNVDGAHTFISQGLISHNAKQV